MNFKKAAALTLSAAMLLQPMTASAATWGGILSGLQASATGRHTTDDGTTAEIVDGTLRVTGGSITDEVAVSQGTLGNVFSIIFDRIQMVSMTVHAAANEHYSIGLDKDTHVTEDVSLNGSGEKASLELTNEGSIDGRLSGTLNGNNGTMEITNNGTIGKFFGGATGEGANREFTNNGTVQGNVGGWANDGASQTLINNGTVGGELSGGSQRGENSTSTIINNNEAGSMSGHVEGAGNSTTVINNGHTGEIINVNAREGASASVTNNGDVDLRMSGWSVGTDSKLTIENADDAFSGTIMGEAYDGSTTTVTNDGGVYGGIGGYAEGAKLDVENNGMVDGNVMVGAGDGANVSADNSGTGEIYGDLYGWTDGEGKASLGNAGKLTGHMDVEIMTLEADAGDDDADDENPANPGKPGTGKIIGEAANGGTVTINNSGEAAGASVSAAEGSQTNLTNAGVLGGLTVDDQNGATNVTNNGAIGAENGGSSVEIWLNNGDVKLTNNGTIASGTDEATGEPIFALIRVTGDVSAEQINERLSMAGVPENGKVLVEKNKVDEAGNPVGEPEYEIITIKQAQPDEEPKEEPKADESEESAPEFEVPLAEQMRHEMEEQRKDEAIGGVFGSPYWIKQMYLGYHSYNLRLYIDGEQVNVRERLSWNADKTKAISFTVNTVNPEKLTMRFDENVLEVFERTEITTVTLLDKNGAPVMQYNVSDLRAAYDGFGLNDADQLVVGCMDDEVMKIGADGQLVAAE